MNQIMDACNSNAIRITLEWRALGDAANAPRYLASDLDALSWEDVRELGLQPA
ncbi:hypothetical protein XCVb0020 (plasmid) [Xanthomonas euvesicatoria pv. vesicatoria str. 85-10]|uniref:Uncharacterized protein n=1 Tax=Xanthomonas euvesicatoria pv. vesicatoria (strain 85-10) TaxID=316273 RepID=Q3C0G6_XANE5|nr:hypothetical protein XCVb0020 [Xanthomonas euvesicatoria pv. vesicatoria str. 85-10]